MHKTKHQMKSENTYKKFMNTLFEMINEENIDNITIRSLCEKVGLSPRSFYLYFPSKEAAILKCYIYRSNEEVDDFQAASLPKQPFERILEIFLKHYQLAVESPKLGRAIYICKLKTYDEELFSDNMQIFKLILDAVQQCQQDKIFKNSIPARDIAWDLIDFTRGVQVDYYSRNESYDLIEVGMKKLKAYISIFIA